MSTRSVRGLPQPEVDGLSRRSVVLGIGAGGIAVALANATGAARAQDGSPAPDGGMPEGMELASLGAVPIRDLPTEPFRIAVARLTLDPGAVVPNAAVPYPSMAYVEVGTGLICPPGGEGRYITDADGNPVNEGGDEMPFPLGTWCYTTPDTMDGVRNDGTERVVMLLLELVPTEE